MRFYRYSPQFLKASKAVPVSLARQKYPRPTADELAKFLNDSLSFLIVRHPFERLLSAYRDKLEHSLPHTFHSKLGSHIVSHYRTKASIYTSLSYIGIWLCIIIAHFERAQSCRRIHCQGDCIFDKPLCWSHCFLTCVTRFIFKQSISCF